MLISLIKYFFKLVSLYDSHTSFIHACMCARMHTCAHTCTHTHTHTNKILSNPVVGHYFCNMLCCCVFYIHTYTFFHSVPVPLYFNFYHMFGVRYNPPITVNSVTDLSQERDWRGTRTKVSKTKDVLFQAEGKWKSGWTRGTFKENKGECKKTKT